MSESEKILTNIYTDIKQIIEEIKGNAVFPKYGLEYQVKGLETALDIVKKKLILFNGIFNEYKTTN